MPLRDILEQPALGPDISIHQKQAEELVQRERVFFCTCQEWRAIEYYFHWGIAKECMRIVIQSKLKFSSQEFSSLSINKFIFFQLMTVHGTYFGVYLFRTSIFYEHLITYMIKCLQQSTLYMYTGIILYMCSILYVCITYILHIYSNKYS